MFLLFFNFIIVRVVEVMTYMYTAHVGKFITRERFMPVLKTAEALGKQLCSIVSAAHAITVFFIQPMVYINFENALLMSFFKNPLML